MTLAPERITVKRRRDEDPVEALYIQSKKQRPGVVWRLQSHADDRVWSNPKPSTEVVDKDYRAAIFEPDGSSITRETTNNDSRETSSTRDITAPTGDSICDQAFANSSPLKPSNKFLSGSIEEREKTQLSNPRLRKFRLIQENVTGLKRQPSFTSKITKRQRPQRENLALFVESKRGEELVERAIRDHRRTDLAENDGEETQRDGSSISMSSTVRKRPNVNAAERAWRCETWGKQGDHNVHSDLHNQSLPATNWDDASMEMAKELQQFSIEQSQGQTHQSSTSKLKFKPKPPGPRQIPGNAIVSNLKPDNGPHSVLDEEGDYTVDTYIRAPLQSSNQDVSSGMRYIPLRDLNSHKIGILVIEEEEETLWEAFGNELDSDPEILSDDEDENAEDFYGNDYPEDEVDVDDEYGRGSYNYRIYASDREEYDDDQPELSDVEDDQLLKWLQ